jgi:hypothetical protein
MFPLSARTSTIMLLAEDLFLKEWEKSMANGRDT